MAEHAGGTDETAAEQPAPRSAFDTRGLPSRKAFALWQEQLDHLADARLTGEPEEFQVCAEAVVLDRVVLGRVQNTGFSYDRSRFRIARDGIDHYMLQFYRNGRIICRKSGAGEAIKPGDITLADMANPETVHITDLDVLSLTAPRALLGPLLAQPEAGGIRHFSGDSVLVKLLYEHVHALYAQTPRITARQAEALTPSLLQMTAAAVNGEVRDETRGGAASALAQAIRRYVAAHANTSDLSPETIAARHGISQRKLSYLFEPDGGVATYVQGERLRRARLALMDPSQRGRTIAEIAEAHRFAHRTSFIRAFQRVYGLTPSQQRALSAGQSNRKADPPQPSPIKWIGRF